MRVQAELAALKTQVDPHFLFNCLNTLGHLIQHDAVRGREFCDTLADVYRYVLDSGQHDLVPLADELAFLRRYHRLLELRSGGAIRLVVAPTVESDARHWRIPPLALQAMLENAVKHNQASAEQPLELTISLCGGDPGAPVGAASIRAVNALRPRRSSLPSAGVGLANLAARCSLATGAALALRSGAGVFEVDVPLQGQA
jgi:LytS/YehU family sensor histidine kinase